MKEKLSITMKKIYCVFVLLVCSFSFGQSLEEKSTNYACDCLKQFEEVDKVQISDCINKGISKSLEESTDKRDKRRFKNIMKAIKIIKTVQANVLQKCLTEKKKD